MPWCIDKIEFVPGAVTCRVIERDALCLDRNAAFALEIHRVQHLVSHLSRLQSTAMLDEPVRQGRLTVIDMRNNREVSDLVHAF